MFEIDQRLVRASFGTTKYCAFYLKGLQCKNKECQYLHCCSKSNKIFTKEMMCSRVMYQEQEKIAFSLAHIENQPYEEFCKEYTPRTKAVFPTPQCIYHRRFAFLPSPLQEHQQAKAKERAAAAVACVESKESIPIKAEVKQNNKFKFIKLKQDTECVPTESTIFTSTNYILQEVKKELESLESQQYLLNYSYTMDCFKETQNTIKPKIHYYCAVPLYTWAYQQISTPLSDKYNTVLK